MKQALGLGHVTWHVTSKKHSYPKGTMSQEEDQTLTLQRPSAEQESQPADADEHRNIEDPSGAGISGAVGVAKVLLDNGPEIGEPAASAEFANMKHMQTEEVDA